MYEVDFNRQRKSLPAVDKEEREGGGGLLVFSLWFMGHYSSTGFELVPSSLIGLN